MSNQIDIKNVQLGIKRVQMKACSNTFHLTATSTLTLGRNSVIVMTRYSIPEPSRHRTTTKQHHHIKTAMYKLCKEQFDNYGDLKDVKVLDDVCSPQSAVNRSQVYPIEPVQAEEEKQANVTLKFDGTCAED
ncbi:hypothetical protein ACTFIV_001595 [Dictyostelium citrinum]